MNKKNSEPKPPPGAPEPQPGPPQEIAPDPERQEAILQEVLDAVRKYREYKRRKGEPDP